MTKDEYMYRYQLDLINDYADKIIKAYNIQIPITNIEEIVSKIGGIVNYTNCKDNLDKNKDKFIINIRDNNDSKIKNLRIAQQLGTLFLYTNFVSDNANFKENNKIIYKNSYYFLGSINLINEFALAFMMPKEEYTLELNKNTVNDNIDTKKIAKHFNVSTNVAVCRGKRLGLVEE